MSSKHVEYLTLDRHDQHERSAAEFFAEWKKDKASAIIKLAP